MATILLVLIYIAFISLGLPDSIIGVAWPSIQADWGLSLDAAGPIAMMVTAGTVVSSFMSGYVVKKIGTGKIVFVSCLMTGLALLGFSLAPSYMWLFFLAIPLGLGAGSVDSALNNYVALHYKSHHMNWLHSFWGVGATLGPVIMGQALASSIAWRGGIRTISIIQLSLAALLLVSLPLWGRRKTEVDSNQNESNEKHKIIDVEAFRIKGVKYALATFAFYCATELSVGLWGSSFLVHAKGVSVDTAAYWIAVYYGSITAGRFISGFISFKVSNKNMIRYGAIIALLGTVSLLLPLHDAFIIIPFILLGLGLSPIFPAMIHETPERFGKDKSQTIIGYQMAFAYMGNIIFPPLFGLIIENVHMMLLPILLIISASIMFFSSERLNSLMKNKDN